MNQCPLCGCSQIHEKGWCIEGRSFLECSKCRFVFLPRPIPVPSVEIYNADYVRARGHDLANSSITRSKIRTAGIYFKKFASYIPVGPMIDIGCSAGANVSKAMDLGWEASGMDINLAALDVARSLVPRAMFYDSLEEPLALRKQFSLVTLFDVIEHIENLHAFMYQVNALLEHKGILFILTPDVQSLSARLFRGKWPHLFAEHISLFSRRNMIDLLKKNNYEILECGFAWKFVSFDGLSRHAQCHCTSHVFGPLRKALDLAKDLDLVFPFNLGEFFIIARKI